MHIQNNGEDKKGFCNNLLSNPHIGHRWIPRFFIHKHFWKVLSGKWLVKSPNQIIYLKQPYVKTAENISIIGSSNWNNLILQIKFKILTDTKKPPEGGVILYTLFKNIKNFYSFHICIFKQRIEFIKRYRGIWSVIAEQEFNVEIQKDYFMKVRRSSGIHELEINGTNQFTACDEDISNGCIGIGIKYCDVELNHVSVLIP